MRDQSDGALKSYPEKMKSAPVRIHDNISSLFTLVLLSTNRPVKRGGVRDVRDVRDVSDVRDVRDVRDVSDTGLGN